MTRHGELREFFARYTVILEAAARRVHRMSERGEFVTTNDLVDWLVKDVWHITKAAWWEGVKPWRVKEFLRVARKLGAFEALEIETVPGCGFRAKERVRPGAAQRAERAAA